MKAIFNIPVKTGRIATQGAVLLDYVSTQSDGEIRFWGDYYPFGMLMPNRNSNSSSYSFGYNNQLKDDEVSNVTGSEYEFKQRMYDPRTGKFWSVDPLLKDYPWNSTYAFAENDVIRCKDLEGLEKAVSVEMTTKGVLYTLKAVDIVADNPNPNKWMTGNALPFPDLPGPIKALSEGRIPSAQIFGNDRGGKFGKRWADFANSIDFSALSNLFDLLRTAISDKYSTPTAPKAPEINKAIGEGIKSALSPTLPTSEPQKDPNEVVSIIHEKPGDNFWSSTNTPRKDSATKADSIQARGEIINSSNPTPPAPQNSNEPKKQ